MTALMHNLQVLDNSSLSKEWDLVTELFHRINRIIPQNQELLTIKPNCQVREAVAMMLRLNYSQIPVVDRGQVLGVFSFRSFAKEAACTKLEEMAKQKCSPGDLTVDEFLEPFEFARVTEEMNRVFDFLDRDNGVLIGTPERPIGILTPMDFLRYLYQVASPFVMISEIELALRALIKFALNTEQIAIAAKCCLSSIYGDEDKVPTTLEEMTFSNYQSMISHSQNWAKFDNIFGGNRQRTSGRLKEIGDIRNALFHFKREITLHDHQTLAGHRNWLLNKIKQAETHRKMEA